MSEQKATPDELTKPTSGDITLTEAQLNDVSGGAVDAFIKLDDTTIKLDDKV